MRIMGIVYGAFLAFLILRCSTGRRVRPGLDRATTIPRMDAPQARRRLIRVGIRDLVASSKRTPS